MDCITNKHMKQIPRTVANASSQKPTQQQIAVAAFHLYMENGCREGHDLEDWLCAERMLTQKVEAVSQTQISEPARNGVSHAVGIQPGGTRENPLARDERGSASREEIRQTMTPSRPAARQPQWRTARRAQTRREP